MRPSFYTLPTLLVVSACTIKGVSLTASIDVTESGGTTTDATSDATSDATGEQTTSQITGESTTDYTTGDPTTATTGEPTSRPLDLLFVVDNSGSMAEEQARLAASAKSLLAAAGDRDLRVGITTTDMGNPRCPNAQHTPETGAMSTASCRERVDAGEFTFNEQDFSSACLDQCPHQSWTITPTATADDPVLKARPWFERTAGIANVDVPLAEAIACSMPQGVAGCGFESHLDAMRAAIVRAQTESEEQFGFLRPEADLTVVFLTDEMDCSFNPEFADIFTTNMVFWTDAAPTSAICFLAGNQCQLAPDSLTCEAVDRDSTGAVTDDPAQAVLNPVSVYADLLADLQASKTGGASVRMIGIAGVPPGFENTGELELLEPPDADFENAFGITPGCVDGTNFAVPPLRMLDVAKTLGAPKFFSICETNFDAALGAAGSQ